MGQYFRACFRHWVGSKACLRQWKVSISCSGFGICPKLYWLETLGKPLQPPELTYLKTSVMYRRIKEINIEIHLWLTLDSCNVLCNSQFCNSENHCPYCSFTFQQEAMWRLGFLWCFFFNLFVFSLYLEKRLFKLEMFKSKLDVLLRATYLLSYKLRDWVMLTWTIGKNISVRCRNY